MNTKVEICKENNSIRNKRSNKTSIKSQLFLAKENKKRKSKIPI